MWESTQVNLRKFVQLSLDENFVCRIIWTTAQQQQINIEPEILGGLVKQTIKDIWEKHNKHDLKQKFGHACWKQWQLTNPFWIRAALALLSRPFLGHPWKSNWIRGNHDPRERERDRVCCLTKSWLVAFFKLNGIFFFFFLFLVAFFEFWVGNKKREAMHGIGKYSK